MLDQGQELLCLEAMLDEMEGAEGMSHVETHAPSPCAKDHLVTTLWR